MAFDYHYENQLRSVADPNPSSRARPVHLLSITTKSRLHSKFVGVSSTSGNATLALQNPALPTP